jgi:hypothetical protein
MVVELTSTESSFLKLGSLYFRKHDGIGLVGWHIADVPIHPLSSNHTYNYTQVGLLAPNSVFMLVDFELNPNNVRTMCNFKVLTKSQELGWLYDSVDNLRNELQEIRSVDDVIIYGCVGSFRSKNNHT